MGQRQSSPHCGLKWMEKNCYILANTNEPSKIGEYEYIVMLGIKNNTIASSYTYSTLLSKKYKHTKCEQKILFNLQMVPSKEDFKVGSMLSYQQMMKLKSY